MARLLLKKKEERRLQSGHQWVFSNEVSRLEGVAENGDIVAVCSHKGNVLGHGFYNKNSLITVRLLGSSYAGNFHDYAESALMKAYELRKTFYPLRESFRMVFSESDNLPGLIIDKYNNTFVLQVYSFGIERNISHIVEILNRKFNAQNIFSLNDEHFRKLEGLDERDEVYLGKVGEEIIDDGKIKYKIDFSGSQKTGFYFDQCDNREFIERFVKGKTVLDAFCNAGGFGMHAAYAGASSVSFVDSSEREISNAKHNYALNNLNTKCDFIREDVFDYLQRCINQNKKFDVVMLDPPSFVKTKKNLPSGVKGYLKLNKLALQIISGSGYLVTSSCSHHLKRDDFIDAVNQSALKSKREIQLLHFAGASLDHPRIPAMEETSYLKFAVFKVWSL